MGLTKNSTGSMAIDSGLKIVRENISDRVIALAGNPNVGKSSVFNELTGLKQHTGNWPGKTVTNAQGQYIYNGINYILVDIPGTYSLMAHSAEEEVARDFICFGGADTVVVVCDATCLERNLNLVLQTLEITNNIIVCVNLIDEARKKKINIDYKMLELKLSVPVVAVSARSKEGLDILQNTIADYKPLSNNNYIVKYDKIIEDAISQLEPILNKKLVKGINSRWLSLKLIEKDESLLKSLNKYLGWEPLKDEEIRLKLDEIEKYINKNGFTISNLKDKIISCIVKKAEDICTGTISYGKIDYNKRDRSIDKILTNKWTGIPIMLILLALIFWITITGANYPSELLSKILFGFENKLTQLFTFLNAPEWLHGILVLGGYRVLAWVVSVMLPPMAIFFPIFTLLEDLGYLPRIAFNLDKCLKKCCACGKQALTMCMGFGCNAAGIVGCRIIDSPRERLIAIITNNFVPCNGRFPTLIAIITMFFVGTSSGLVKTITSSIMLVAVILVGIIMTFAVSKILSSTILKGVPSSFTLELPPYRKPKIGSIIIRSIFDRTLFVLGRAIVVAIPAGFILWLMANLKINDISILSYCCNFLNPFGHLIGLDGVILMAFILGFPANEIVIPIIIMAYLSNGTITDFENLAELKELLVNNGWTWLTAVCTMLFSLMHWPCSTTCLTIKKETKSLKWTLISFAVPTVIGILVCFIVASISRLLGLA